MKKIFSKFISITTALAVVMSMGIFNTFAEEDSFPVYAQDKLSSSTIASGEKGKLSNDGFFRVTAITAGTHAVKREAPMSDFYCGFNVKLNPGSVDYIDIVMEAWKEDWSRVAMNDFLRVSETGGVVVSSSSAIAEEYRGKTLVPANKFKYGEWHRVELYRCFTAKEVKVWIDGTLYNVALNDSEYEDSNGNGYCFGRYGLNAFVINAYVNAVNHYIDFDNYVYETGTDNAMRTSNDAHKTNHNEFDTASIKGAPTILSTNEGSVQNNILKITDGITVGNFLHNIYKINTDAVRVYEDNTYAKLLSQEEVMKAGNVVVAALGEKYFSYYTVETAQSLTKTEVYTVNDFSTMKAIVLKSVYDGTLQIKPMVDNDSALTEKISAGNGGKIAQDRIYTFIYDTSPKIEQFTSLFQSESYTDNYTEFDFKLNDDNTQLKLYYNYFTSDAHKDNKAIDLLNISSEGIAVANDAVNLKNPGVKLVESIEPTQWHRLGIFFSSSEDAVIVYYDGVKYEIPVVDGSNFLKYGARAVRWQPKSKRESSVISIDNLYMEPLYEGTVDYSSRLVNKPVLTSFNGVAVSSDILSNAQGMTVADFKEKIAFRDTTAVRLYTDGTYSEEITYNDSYVLTAASKLVLSNNEQLFAYYSMGEATSVSIASNALTIDGNYIHGYANSETVQTLISKISLPAGASAAVYSGSTQAEASAKIAQGMILRVLSADKTRSKDYTICNGELFVGGAEYVLNGVNKDGSYTTATIDITIPVINYTNTTKTLSVYVARYNGEEMEVANVYDKNIAANFSGDITQQHKDLQSRQAGTSYKVFVWEKNSLTPVKKSMLYSSNTAGKKIVVFGDSISAPVNDGYVTMLAANTGADIINAAIAGSRVVDRDDKDAFGMYKVDLQNIVDGIITPNYDWSTQKGLSTSAPNVLNFEKIDLSNTDAAIIWLGTNDFGTNVTITDFESAVKDALDKLTSNYPDLKIILASPIYRDRMSGGDGRNCYEYPNSTGSYLYDYRNALENVAKSYTNVTFFDLYNESGITKFSNKKYNYLSDGLHPYTGNTSRAYRIITALFADKLADILK